MAGQAFGYGPDSNGWLPEKQELLYQKLHAMVDAELKDVAFDFLTRRPFVELHGRSQGVRIMGLGVCQFEVQQKVVSRAEEIYREVMELPVTDEQEPIPGI